MCLNPTVVFCTPSPGFVVALFPKYTGSGGSSPSVSVRGRKPLRTTRQASDDNGKSPDDLSASTAAA